MKPATIHQHSSWFQVLLYTRPTIKISPLPTTRRARRRGSRAPGGTRDDETTESDIQRDCWGRTVCGKKDFRQCQSEGVADGESGESTTEKEEATGAGRKESEMQRDCDEVVFSHCGCRLRDTDSVRRTGKCADVSTRRSTSHIPTHRP